MSILKLITQEVISYAISKGITVDPEKIETRLQIISRNDDNYLKILYRSKTLNYSNLIERGWK